MATIMESDQKYPVYVGTAGWTIPASAAGDFSVEGTHLERYARRLPAVEINSSFYRPHRTTTYERWAASVPDDFRFAVKVPREITHHLRLKNTVAPLERFLAEVSGLGGKLGPLLVQLPPTLKFDAEAARSFFADLRERFTGNVVCEPRHETWFRAETESLLEQYQIARVAADPAPVPEAARPAGWTGLVYYRLHGSPKVYYSDYSEGYLGALRQDLRKRSKSSVWCIFDNTALGAATLNALSTTQELETLIEEPLSAPLCRSLIP
jgi:uncharacterized protein YecE (DUF72 family)